METEEPERQGKLVAPGEGKILWVAGELVTFTMVGEDTGGAFTLMEGVSSRGDGPPPHIHHREDETFYVLAVLLPGSPALAQPRAISDNPRFSAPPFGLGVASGDPLPQGVVLWTRVAPEPHSAIRRSLRSGSSSVRFHILAFISAPSTSSSRAAT